MSKKRITALTTREELAASYRRRRARQAGRSAHHRRYHSVNAISYTVSDGPVSVVLPFQRPPMPRPGNLDRSTGQHGKNQLVGSKRKARRKTEGLHFGLSNTKRAK